MALRNLRFSGLRLSPVGKRLPRRLVQGAVKRGRVEKASHCSVCSRYTPGRRLHAHHTDYDRPLCVVWVCASCHGTIHGKRRRSKRYEVWMRLHDITVVEFLSGMKDYGSNWM